MKLPFNPKTDLMQAFPTPMGLFKLPNHETLCPKIADVVLEREKREPGLEVSNLGGWHSDGKMLGWPELQFADLADTFRSATSHMIAATCGVPRFETKLQLAAWANVNRAGSSNASHIHPEFHWSGVLYVQTPDLSKDPVRKAGNIEFQDPRGPVSMLKTPGQTNLMSIPVEQGMILVFPSWLFHWVNAFSLDAIRISIAFNARIEQFREVKV